MLVVGDRGRDNRLTTGSVSAFGIFGEVSGDVDCVDVHRGDLGFWFVFGINFLRFTMRHVALNSNNKIHLFLSLVPPLERFEAKYVTLFLIGSKSRNTSPTCTLVST
jgi:hypothetical protein